MCLHFLQKNLKIDEPAKSEKKAEVKKSKPAAKKESAAKLDTNKEVKASSKKLKNRLKSC